MISNQLLQKAVDEMKELVNSEMMIMDMDGRIAAKTFSGKPIMQDAISKFASSDEESANADGFKLFKVKNELENEYILAVKGTSNNTNLVGRLARYQIETLIVAYKEKFDKDNFYRSLLLDNLLLNDIYGRSEKLRIEAEKNRVVYIISADSKIQDDVLNTVRNIFVGSNDDFVVALDKEKIVVVKQLADNENYDTLANLSKRISNAVKSDEGYEPDISYGTIVSDLKDVSKSYKEAKMALEVGRIFFEDKKINAYIDLGIGRLIYQLPMPLCKLYIKEIFGDGSPKDLDEETLDTINKFLECSLNVSETSRQLFIHRNTLVYRLDKIQKTVGLDLRQFDDAILFKIALMVSKYMQYVEKLENK